MPIASQFQRYVQLLVEQGCNVQPRQQVLIRTEPSNLKLAQLAAAACYARGALNVDIEVDFPRLERLHAQSAPEGLNFVPDYKAVRVGQIVDSRGAVLYFLSQDEPDLYADMDEASQHRLNTMLVQRREATRRLRLEGVLQGKVSWCGAGPPSPGWASKVFPDLPPKKALQALWRDILAFSFADREDCLSRWDAHLHCLDERAAQLTRRRISSIHFKNPLRGADLTVGLSASARWVGASQLTADGIKICCNIPSYEVYTTPDWRLTEGTVGTTRPAMINGTLVEGLWLRFSQGRIVEVKAERNAAAFEALIATDLSARQLGEVALVGTDSPIFQNGRIFQHGLYDENAACHIATGLAYTAGLENGDRLSPPELDAIGCNRAARTHQDLMISDETTQVFGDDRQIIENGRWLF